MAFESLDPVPEEEAPAWSLLKSKILTDIFKLAPEPIFLPLRTPTSRIVIFFASQSATEAESTQAGTLELNSKGFDNIMSDLRVLGNTPDSNGNFEIHNPAAPAYKRGIYVITNQSRKIILEGRLHALTGLLARLRTPGKGLAHMAKRFYDDEGMRKAYGHVYELGAGTMKELQTIEAKLYAKGDGCEVLVKWVYIAKTATWPAKLY